MLTSSQTQRRDVPIPRSTVRRGGAQRALRRALACAALAAAACVSLDKSGARVELREAAQITSCQKIAVAKASTLSRIVFRRSEQRMAKELSTLARNQAGELGGDAIVPSSPISEGKQSFDVYRCSNS